MGDTPPTTGNAALSAPAGDPLRRQLLDAAARVFARKGYEGTKILDIVREAGLSTGAVYGRFRSKNDLLREAVVRQASRAGHPGGEPAHRVADLVARGAADTRGQLSDDEAVRLEAYVAARREPEVAQALAEAQERWRASIDPLVAAALADGTVSDDVDPEAVLFFVRTMALGLLVHRGSGLPGPDPEAWQALVRRIVASFGRADTTEDVPPTPSRPAKTTKNGRTT